MAISLFVAGDVVPMGPTVDLFKTKQTKKLFGNIIPQINCDLNIVNFEAPIASDNATPILKSGPAIRTTSETLEVLKEAGFNTITLANNHFRDFDQEGVEQTIDCAKRLNIGVVGGGKDKMSARKILYFPKDDKTLAIINACEHEYSIASEDYGGSNPLDLIQMQEDIVEAKKKADYVVLILHGGIELYQLPTPRMKRWYHHFVDLGVDAIINHHQHCFSGYEIYNGKPIFYGLGNFNFHSFLPQIPMDKWNRGYAVKLNFDHAVSFTLIPYVQNDKDTTIRIRSQETFDSEIQQLNKQITDDQILNDKFQKYIVSEGDSIKMELQPFKNRILMGLIRRGFLGKLYDGKKLYSIKNKLACESHYEKIMAYFKLQIKNGE